MSNQVYILCLALLCCAGVAAGASGCAVRQPGAAMGQVDDLDGLLAARVQAALAGAADVESAAITVEARRGVVTLTGRVASGTEQQSVGAIVRAIPGVSDVRFALQIDDRDDPGELP